MIETMFFDGLLIGVVSFLIIGAFHPLVIKSEYHFGVRVWPVFLFGGLLCSGLSVFTAAPVLRAILGLTAFSFFWSIHELFAQRERVRKGWFPRKKQ
jgi:DMSO/TMAO reductase YedYZ heme-binding membrane subunit